METTSKSLKWHNQWQVKWYILCVFRMITFVKCTFYIRSIKSITQNGRPKIVSKLLNQNVYTNSTHSHVHSNIQFNSVSVFSQPVVNISKFRDSTFNRFTHTIFLLYTHFIEILGLVYKPKYTAYIVTLNQKYIKCKLYICICNVFFLFSDL